MLAYRDAVDGLYSFSVAEFTRRQELSAKIETRTAQGRWGVTERDFLPSSRRKQGHLKSASASSPPVAATPRVENLEDAADAASPLLVDGLSADDHMLPSSATASATCQPTFAHASTSCWVTWRISPTWICGFWGWL